MNTIEKIKKKIAERKEMIKSGESSEHVQYDKGYIHAMGDAIDLIKEDKEGEKIK